MGYWYLLVGIPLIDAVLFGSIGVAYESGKHTVPSLIFGILFFQLIWQLTFAGSNGFLTEVWDRNVLNLFATPLREAEYGFAVVSVGLMRTVISSSLILFAGLVFFAIDPSGPGLIAVPSAIILLFLGVAVSGFVVGLALQFGESAEVFSWGTLLLLLPISGVFYPIDSLPGALQTAAKVSPLTAIFESLREGLEGGRDRLGLGTYFPNRNGRNNVDRRCLSSLSVRKVQKERLDHEILLIQYSHRTQYSYRIQRSTQIRCPPQLQACPAAAGLYVCAKP